MDNDWGNGRAQKMGRFGWIIYIQGLLEFDSAYVMF
jgi:hypothetical protein